MKAKDVMKLLQITRGTLFNYTKDRKIKVTKLDNGYYDYDEESIFKIMKKDPRINVIYSRVSTYKQKNDLDSQTNKINNYCNSNNIIINKIYSDISSGLDLDRTAFNNLMNDVINLKIKNIYISHKDRLTRLSFKTIKNQRFLILNFLINLELILLKSLIIKILVITLMITKYLKNGQN